jgi:hypothetical protein
MSSIVSSIRLDSNAKDRIQRAARKIGVTYNEFIASSAADRALVILQDEEGHESNFVDGILAVARELDFSSASLTSRDAIKDPFAGLADRTSGKRRTGASAA